jgi:hypothetical protein
MKEQVYIEFVCSVCGDPCVLRIFDISTPVTPSFCPWRIDEQTAWTKREVVNEH